jgi:hypothetical protein
MGSVLTPTAIPITRILSEFCGGVPGDVCVCVRASFVFLGTLILFPELYLPYFLGVNRPELEKYLFNVEF